METAKNFLIEQTKQGSPKGRKTRPQEALAKVSHEHCFSYQHFAACMYVLHICKEPLQKCVQTQLILHSSYLMLNRIMQLDSLLACLSPSQVQQQHSHYTECLCCWGLGLQTSDLCDSL